MGYEVWEDSFLPFPAPYTRYCILYTSIWYTKLVRKIVFLGIIVILGLFVLWWFQKNPAHRLKSWQVSFDLSGFKLQSFLKEDKRQKLEAIRGETRVELTKIKAEDNQKFIEDKKFLLKSLFEPTTSPYPEVITNIIDCPQEFKPKSQEVKNGTIYTLFAGERLNYGICSRDLVKYNSAYGIFDCQNKGIFEIKVFDQDEQTVKNLISTFAC